MLISLLVLITSVSKAQTTPASASDFQTSPANTMFVPSDTINFDPYPTGTVITNQYLYNGAFFSGYNGSTDPIIHDYFGSYGRTLHSDNWYNALRLNFVNPLNQLQYDPVKKIEFDNPIDSEVDYISVTVYDSLNTIIYQYVSTSPQHVVINLGANIGAYMIFDDSASTAYVIDNIVYDRDSVTGVNSIKGINPDISIFPVPCHDFFDVLLNSPVDIAYAAISVYDVLGNKTEVPVSKSNNGFHVTCSGLSPGVYFLRIVTDKKQLKTGKITVY